jgi:hypothetical protein
MKANIRVIREKRTKESTIGSMFINDKFFAYTLEDYDRDANKDGDLNDIGEKKVMHETAIPSGTYKVELTMSVRMKRLLPILYNVPGFEGIRIHSGNNKSHTSGCILVGYQRGDDFIGTSKKAEQDLVEELKKYSEIEITIE